MPKDRYRVISDTGDLLGEVFKSREYSDAILELAARIKEQPSEGMKAGLERLQDDGSWLDVGPWIAKRELL